VSAFKVTPHPLLPLLEKMGLSTASVRRIEFDFPAGDIGMAFVELCVDGDIATELNKLHFLLVEGPALEPSGLDTLLDGFNSRIDDIQCRAMERYARLEKFLRFKFYNPGVEGLRFSQPHAEIVK
jgi:hypothetical protein